MNDDLMIATLAAIEREPKRWRQTSFPIKWSPLDCQTAFCVAGHVVAQSEVRWEGSAQAARLLGIAHHDGGMIGTAPAWDGPTPGSNEYRDEGAWSKWLNGHPLFHASNDLDTLYAIAAHEMGIAVEVLRDKVAAEVAK